MRKNEIMKKVIIGILIFTILIVKNSFAQTDTTFIINDKYGKTTYFGKMLNGEKIGTWIENKYDSTEVTIKTYFENRFFEAKYYRKNTDYPKFIGAKPMILRSIYNGYVDSLGKDVYHGKYENIYYSIFPYYICYYCNNYIEGAKTTFDYYNDTSKIETYKKSLLNGTYKEFYPKSKIKISGQYENENKIGIWTEFYENGNKKSIGEYLPEFYTFLLKKDTSVTKVKIKNSIIEYDNYKTVVYNSKGKLIDEEKYTNQTIEILDKMKINFFDYGNYYKMHLKNGIWQYWDENGNLIKTENYKKGKLLKNK
jgi:antitoxin component YwqK of YwqJK toxin-antitoxin module